MRPGLVRPEVHAGWTTAATLVNVNIALVASSAPISTQLAAAFATARARTPQSQGTTAHAAEILGQRSLQLIHHAQNSQFR